MLTPFAYQWIALALLFLLGGVFSEYNVRYGYVIIPLMYGLMWFVGWIPISNALLIIPLLTILGVLSYLREQLRIKFMVAGSGSGLFWKIVSFMMFLQFSIIFVNSIIGIGTGVSQLSNTVTTDWQLQNSSQVYGSYTSVSSIDAVFVGLTIIWNIWNVLWQMVLSIFTIFPMLINTFHCPTPLALILSGGFYMMFALEIFVLVYRPQKPPEM